MTYFERIRKQMDYDKFIDLLQDKGIKVLKIKNTKKYLLEYGQNFLTLWRIETPNLADLFEDSIRIEKMLKLKVAIADIEERCCKQL